MVFFVVMPIFLSDFRNLLVPLQLGTSKMVYPRANTLSFWLFFLSFVTLHYASSVPTSDNSLTGAGVRWTMYPPLSVQADSSMDYLIFTLHLNSIASAINARNVISTVISGTVLK
jgi:heme/copper-type cytochrome/quinol oxidase subunit 1